MGKSMWAGCAKVDITPPFSVHLIRTGTMVPRSPLGVNHRLYARVVVLQEKAAGIKSRFVVIISADIFYFSAASADRLRSAIVERWHIENEGIILNGTHTHSAPYAPTGFYSMAIDPALDEEYDRYTRWMEEQILVGVAGAMNSMEEVYAERGSGACAIASYRRKQVDGKWLMAPDEQVPTDSEVSIIQFRKPGGEVKALIVNYACHPTTTYDDYISSDFPGAAMDLVEAAYDGGVVSLFLQGCCGDIKPRVIRDGWYYHGNDEDVRNFAGQLADEVLKVVNQPMQPVTTDRFIFLQTRIQLPFRHVPTIEELASYRNDGRELMRTWSKKLMAHPQFLLTDETFELTYVRIADNLGFLAMNGEVVQEYGRYIKEVSAGQVIPLGYSNGHTTYIPTDEQLAQGGYEADEVFYVQGLPSPWAMGIEQQIKQAIREMLAEQGLYKQ